MRILINAVAASSSGALGILQEYYQRAVDDESNEFLFLVSTPQLDDTPNVTVSRFPWVKKSWFHRLVFDWTIAPIVVRKYDADRIVSLQNLAMHLTKVPQTIYEHNCIPPAFCDYRFSIVQEPVLWVRQNILGRMIQRSLKKADKVIVQTQWMKRRCVDNLGIDSRRIEVQPPKLSALPEGRYQRTFPVEFLYPATHMSFKRHELIVEAVEELSIRGRTDCFKVFFTVSGEESRSLRSLRRRVVSRGLPIEFLGWQSREDLYRRYGHSVLLFSSELESFPLPLIEAAAVAAPIVAPDLEYAYEALKGYESAFLYKSGCASSLANAMEGIIDES